MHPVRIIAHSNALSESPGARGWYRIALIKLVEEANRMKTLLCVLTILGSLLGGFTVFVGVATANGAPLEASAAAIGIAFAVIPYYLARAASEIGKP